MWRSYGDAEIPIEESSRKGKPPPTSGVVLVGEIAVGETAPLLTPPHRTESASMIAALALTLAALPAAPAAIQSSSNQSSPTQASLGGLSVTPFAPTMQANLVGARMLNVRLNLPTQAWQEEFILAIPSTVAWPAPVLTLFHGYGEEPDDVVANSPLVGEAMARGFVVFIPLGAHKYNYGIDYAQRNIELAFEFLSARLPIDLDRIYAAGFSMGGGAAASFAARHQDPDGLRIAAVVNHTGTASLRATYQQSNDTGLFNSPLMFGGSPSQVPFAYQRSSTIDFDALGGQLEVEGEMASNLSHVPTRHWNADFDPNPYIVEQTEKLHDQMVFRGADSARHVVQSSVHAWNTMDPVAVMDWLAPQVAELPAPGGVHRTMVDRSGRWNQLEVEQAQPDAFTPVTWSSQPVGNMLYLIEMANAGSISAQLDDLALDGGSDVRVVLQVTDASTPDVSLTGFTQSPMNVLRRGVSTSAWTYDAATGTVTLEERGGAGWSDWTIVP